ncbi:hypothetical protein AAMO2058_001313700 [Amorphochlora amoebiformis]
MRGYQRYEYLHMRLRYLDTDFGLEPGKERMAWAKGLTGEGLEEMRRVLEREAYNDEAKAAVGRLGRSTKRKKGSARKVLIIQTGGTIDKDYPRTTKGYAFEITEPAARRILSKIKADFVYKIVSVCRKDSTEITTVDRQKLLRMCSHPEVGHVVVTHGTDTLIETAKFLEEAYKWKKNLKRKVIVVTGAMRPEKFVDSDADFNLGTAIAALDVCKPGVYVAMNARIRRASDVKRDLSSGMFLSSKL